MTKVIGIDLGTSNSAAAVVMGGKPTIIPAAEGATVGGKAFPSVVAFSKQGDLLVGEPARRQAVTNPDNTIVDFRKSKKMLKHLLANLSKRQSLLFQHILMITRDKLQKMPVLLLDWMLLE
jgi:molecular chaperone DnaK (HSP70)